MMKNKGEKLAKKLFLIFWGVIVFAIIFFKYLDYQEFRYSYTLENILDLGVAVKGGYDVTYSFIVDSEKYKTTNRLSTEEYRILDKSKQYIVRYSTLFPDYSEILVNYPISRDPVKEFPEKGWEQNPLIK